MSQALFHSKILSFASYIPDNFVPIEEFAAVGDLPGKLDLHRLTGIDGHRRSDLAEGSLELATKAAKKCIHRSKIEPDKIDLVINCAVSNLSSSLGLHISPSMATIIAKELGINEAICFDISNACSGMITSLMIADSMIKSGEIETALIVSGENITSLIDEAKSIEKDFDKISKYLLPRAVKIVKSKGKYISLKDGKLETPLVDSKACVYVHYESNGTLSCAIEKAYIKKEIDFNKPISCHLYPIRVKEYSEFTAVNYHKRDICSDACSLGDQLKKPVFEFVKDALIKKFGKQWFLELEKIAKKTKKNLK